MNFTALLIFFFTSRPHPKYETTNFYFPSPLAALEPQQSISAVIECVNLYRFLIFQENPQPYTYS